MVVVPDFDKDDHRIMRDSLRDHEKKKVRSLMKKSCIVCGKKAIYCMRGIPNNTYCKVCAKDHFKFLNYLERL